ncbi:YidC/Oxa1 family membrane protein insertase [Nakamurella panacisegetis]|uniref:Membrane protein insertase YidC n=1 Tax=Nakamurella panacisegetis TaxID=1090615 RepID=A0A1H0L6R5_9ACTN|nr:membrane protein insertase YidC [Nakamurella panacisegetis]SDO63954.1 YidC/Oxa1 family membrane protein insertase [Nakamurella panacisegetis]
MKSFDFFSLDYIYYPVSGIMWVWHKVFGSFLGANNGWAWVLSVVFLVFTLRSLLFKPFMGQMNSQMKMQAVAPELKKLREKYKDDRTRLAEEMQKFNKEAGVNPLGGCLPALVQAPVFIGLFHVLRSFKPNQGENYFFGASDVKSFIDAKLFGGAPLSAYMTQPWVTKGATIGLGPEGLDGIRSTVIAVGIPLTILAGIATFLTSRRSIARTKQLQGDQEAAPQAAIMNKLMQYVFPLFVVVGGPFFPLAILFYWLSNNSWTFGQLYVAHRIQDKKMLAESKIVEEAKEAAKFSKPAPGARPVTRPAPGARPTAGTKPGTRPVAGAKPATGAKRPVVQPSKKPGSTNRSGNGPDDGSSRAAGGPSLSKNGAAGGTGGGGSADLPTGRVSDTSAPRPAPTNAKKKKPGQR